MIDLSESVIVLEKLWGLLNKEYFESALSKPVITIQSSPKAFGHFTTKRVWVSGNESRFEINISAEFLNRPFLQTVSTLLHEMVHQYCAEKGIQDTSRGGVYHNKRFKELAEARHLLIGYDNKIGWSVTSPSDGLVNFVEKYYPNNSFPFHRHIIESAHSKKKKSSTRKYVCPCCGMSVRATKEVEVICAKCQVMMLCEDTAAE